MRFTYEYADGRVVPTDASNPVRDHFVQNEDVVSVDIHDKDGTLSTYRRAPITGTWEFRVPSEGEWYVSTDTRSLTICTDDMWTTERFVITDGHDQGRFL